MYITLSCQINPLYSFFSYRNINKDNIEEPFTDLLHFLPFLCNFAFILTEMNRSIYISGKVAKEKLAKTEMPLEGH